MDKRVTLQDLKKARVRATIGNTELVFRALSHLEIQERDEYALYAMASRRKEIETPGTKANTIYYNGLEISSDDELRGTIAINAARQLWRDAVRAIKPKSYPMPDDPSDEEKITVLKQRDDEPTRVRDEQSKWVKEQLEQLDQRTKELKRPDLLALAKSYQVNEQVNQAWTRAFQDYTIFASVYEDWECTKRVFETPEAVSELPGDPTMFARQLRDEFLEVYFSKVDKVRETDLQNFFSTIASQDSLKPGILSGAANDQTK